LDKYKVFTSRFVAMFLDNVDVFKKKGFVSLKVRYLSPISGE